MSVHVQHLTKLYGSQKALDDVSFEIKSKQVTGLLGPNGAGKSTLMKIVTCFLPQSSGTATVCGFDVNDFPMEVKRRVGYLPEHNPLYTEMYVKEYLHFVASVHGLKKEATKRTAEMISRTGLEKESHKKIGMLSKGYRQRVGLAQALIHNPEVLILDEPTSGLDPNQLVEIRELIRDIGKEKTVVLSTHIMQEVEAMCSRVIIINHGKIVADEETSQLRKQSLTSTILVIEFDREVSRDFFDGIAGIISCEHSGTNSWKITTDAATDIRPALFQAAVNGKLTVLGLRQQEQKLEDIFREVTS